MRETPIVDADFFRAPITVVVEDSTTRVFLNELWQDPRITVRVGGGHAGVKALVEGATTVAQRVVVGLVDLDFGTSNKSRWSDPNLLMLKLDRHEIENYMLQWDVLDKLAKKPPGVLLQIAKNHAQSLVWWMACKRVLARLSHDFNEGFPGAPKVPPDPQAADPISAVSYLAEHPFWRAHTRTMQGWRPGDIEIKIRQEGGQYSHDLTSDRWLSAFSGKELLRHLRANASLDVVTRQTSISSAQRDEDLARRVAREMRKAASAPPDLAHLHALLYQRAGLPPGSAV